MLKTLFAALLSGCALISHAQKIEFGLNGGICPNKLIKDWSLCPDPPELKYKTGNFLGAKAAINYAHWQPGVSVEKYQTSFSENSSITGTGTYSYNSVAAGVFTNRLFRTKTGYFYAGASVGYVYTNYQHTADPERLAYSMSVGKMDLSGFYSGVQVGVTRRLYKQLSANAELSTRYTYSENEKYRSTTQQLLIPVTIGIRYEF